jgi:ferric-dicitrate binding protein FerR (iron transport regulator)
MACPHPENLAAVAEGRVFSREREELLDHAADCDDCRRILLTLQVEQPVPACGRVPVSVRLSRPSGVPWAVSAGIVLAVAGLFLFAIRPAPQTEAPEARRMPPAAEPRRENEEPAPPRADPPALVARRAAVAEAPRAELPRPAPGDPGPDAPPAAEAPAPSPAVTPPPPAPPSVAAVAELGVVDGEVFVRNGTIRTKARAGQSLLPGEGVECEGPRSAALVAFADRTRVELGGDTVLGEVLDRDGTHGRRLFVEKGVLKAEVARQPAGLPMILETPHGEARVLGTTLALHVDPDPKKGIRLEVEEGRVELRNRAGRTVLVDSGHQAVAASGAALAVRPLPREEVLFSFTFEDGKRPALASAGVVERGPGNRFCLAGDPDPGGTGRVFIGDNERGLFTVQGDEVLSFDYWVDPLAGSVNFNLWNRTQKRTHDGEVPKLILGKWTRASFRLADLGGPDSRPKLGDWIVNLHLQGTGTPPRRVFFDNIQITRTRVLKPRVVETKK